MGPGKEKKIWGGHRIMAIRERRPERELTTYYCNHHSCTHRHASWRRKRSCWEYEQAHFSHMPVSLHSHIPPAKSLPSIPTPYLP